MVDLTTAAGRPAASASHASFSIGLDVGGTKVRGVVTDADGTIVAGARKRTRAGVDGVLHTIGSVVDDLVADAAIDIAAVERVGLGVPGVVDPAAGVISHAVNLGIHDPFDIASALGDRLGVHGRVHLENDVNAAALGVAEALGLRSNSVAVISSGTGLAAGFVVEGRLWRGHRGAAGEIGHISVDPTGPICKCGQRGCLELYASGTAIARMLGPGSPPPRMKQIFAAATAGDATARHIVDTVAEALAVAIRFVTLSMDPERIFLMGGLASVGTPLLDAVLDAVAKGERDSPFLLALRMPERVGLVPDVADLPARGAARLGAV
ncbi:ROK family protein [Labedella populi]|uniref:ROK family protein n=1 Tax=Labedella populi TaxID=2498850 RepID=A0A3S4E1X1_9MICO|nr:ROK family protein [Labedella populi]RWZ64427.1 ROK family protein [Labedella populi]